MNTVAKGPTDKEQDVKTITKHFINGDFVDSLGTETMDLINPANGQVIGRVTLGNAEDARRAIRAAKVAFKSYSKSTLEERAKYLKALHDSIQARTEEHTAAMVEEYGGVLQFSRASAQRGAKAFLLAKDNLNKVAFERDVGVSHITLEAVGVAGLITPWNSNINAICTKVAAALAAGCTVVVKPSEFSAIQTQLVMECFAKAGLPPGVINIVNGRGDVVGAELTRSPDVMKISFTGSTVVGKSIARESVDLMKRVTLELGGKSANIILDDADLSKAIPFALMAAFMNNGQACIAGTRLLVPESKLEEVKIALKKAVSALKVGNPADADTAIGPLVSEKQWSRVQGYIQKGIEEGAEVLVGGLGRPQGLEAGFFIKPTVFVNVTSDMTIAKEEIFGPVLSVLAYRTEEEAIEIANATSYGLMGYVSSSSPTRARSVADQLEAGTVMINDFHYEPNAPFGGVKQSGVGRELGVYGIESYLEPKAVAGR
jgi:aldehyde dehydrogenase (NAD+)